MTILDAAPSVSPLVELKGITKAFGATVANANIDLTIFPSDIVGLVGGNGAGKSTLMRILSGGLSPSLGQLSISGQSVDWSSFDTRAAKRQGVRMVHQELS